jgi:hypothetical protein
MLRSRDELIADQRTGLAFDYRRRTGVAHIEIMTPHGSPARSSWTCGTS